MELSFYDHHRQTYGHAALHGGDDAVAEFMVGDYGPEGDDNRGVGEGGEFRVAIYRFSHTSRDDFFRNDHHLVAQIQAFSDATGTLRAFLDSGAWEALAAASESHELRHRDDVTALLVANGIRDASHYPVGHVPVCPCCDRPTGASLAVGDLEAGYNAFWGWLRDHLSVEECEAVELAGVHPDDWKAAAESCIRAARGERDHRPFTTYPDLPRDVPTSTHNPD